MAGIKRRKCCNCNELFIPDPRNASVRDIVVNPNVAKPARRPVRDVGYKSPRTKTTLVDRKTSSGFNCGGRPTRDTGGGNTK